MSKESPEVLAAASVDEEVHAVLQPIDAEEDEVQPREVRLVVHHVEDRDGSHKDEVAEADDKEDGGQTVLALL